MAIGFYTNAYDYAAASQGSVGFSVGIGGSFGTSGKVDGVNGELSPEATREAKRTGKVECQTCKERKYQDGSDEMVSFKASAHISPQAAGSRVRAHEQEHVSNAYKKAATGDGKVLQASVRIKTAVCPECGRSYVAGGVTDTKIKYNEKNPYEKNAKSFQAEATRGNAIDAAV